MNDSIQDLFKDKNYCCEEICRIREAIGVKGASDSVFESSSKTLAFMYLYCPKELQSTVESQMLELEKRKTLIYLYNLRAE